MATIPRHHDRGPGNTDAHSDGRAPLRILAERYARGEIRREEFLQIRNDLIEQEALAGTPVGSSTPESGDLALAGSVTPDANLLSAVSKDVVAAKGTQASRILAGLIRGLYLDGSQFHFDLLERLEPERRAWAEALIKAKLERLIPLHDWAHAYEITRDCELHTDGDSTVAGPPPAGMPSSGAVAGSPGKQGGPDDWKPLFEEVERFLDEAKNGEGESVPGAAAADGKGDTKGADASATIKPTAPSPAMDPEAPTMIAHDGAMRDRGMGHAQAPHVEWQRAEATPARAYAKPGQMRRYGVVALIIVLLVAVAFIGMRQDRPSKTVPSGPVARQNAATAPAKTDAGPVSAPGLSAAPSGTSQEQSGRILPETPTGSTTSAPASENQERVVPAETGEKPAPVEQLGQSQQASPTTLTAPSEAPAKAADRKGAEAAAKVAIASRHAARPSAAPSKPAPSKSPTSERKLSSRVKPAETAVALAIPLPAPPGPATPVAAAPTIAASTTTTAPATAAPTTAAPAPAAQGQVAAVVPTPSPPLPAPRADDIETWAGGDDALQQGMRYYQAGNFKGAADNLQKALEAGLRLKRSTVTAHKYLALSHCALGRENQCRQEFQQALRIDPALSLRPDEAAAPRVGAAFGSAKESAGK